MLTLRKCQAAVVLGVTLTACGSRPLTVATRPSVGSARITFTRNPHLAPLDPTHAPKLPRIPPRRARVVPKRLLPPPTTMAPTPTTTPPAAPTSIQAVMACIRGHESGDYTINSHGPDGSSGAYQFTGPTWRAWSARAGYPGTAAAYLASPAVQDAVTAYTLTHGGAGNWSMRWGNDPCTAGLPGGG